MNKRILLTGATGFLGSHIANKLIASGHRLMLSRRDQSDFSRCTDFKTKAEWVNLNASTWEADVEQFKPDIILHTAWQGVVAGNRENWRLQIENLFLQQQLLDIAKKIHVETFIGFGSQAEYGEINKPPEETDPTNATTAYGIIKLAALQIIRSFCEQNHINWIWLRLFSIFGENESEQWLIPSTIKKIKKNQMMALTPGEQQMAYIYVKDLTEIISNIINTGIPSGVYNLSGNHPVSIKDLVTKIKDLVNPDYPLVFGDIPYRPNQPMMVMGNTNKLKKALSFVHESDFETNLKNVVHYYIKHS